jgi:hypothetical protein
MKNVEKPKPSINVTPPSSEKIRRTTPDIRVFPYLDGTFTFS